MRGGRLAAFKRIIGKVDSFSIGSNAMNPAEVVEDSVVATNGIETLRVAALGVALFTEPVAPSKGARKVD